MEAEEIGISIILIPHNNPGRFKIRLERDLLPTLTAHPSWKFQVIVVDNSDDDKRVSCEALESCRLSYICERPGTNIMYGPAMNLAVQGSHHPYLVYLCSNHGHMYDPTWIDDLINPLISNEKIAMTGSQCASGDPSNMGFSSHLPRIHIQGGIFAARRETLIAHPYTNDHRFIHWGSDIYECFQLMSAGFQLHHVDTINSVWRQTVSSPERWKYVHDDSE
ncbi:hypothetical protein GZH53_19045 [Flavihumibacter sp. R14]|nr:hypothetical protein [Flavihumibacter soli]